ncbi:hypothetical protein DYU11_01630 [Fibrisoma montanum]|uniref:Uncharacterized protein n=1 Tax=Fibrisoma montanum TaxID=2305895 RepID=A0A418MHZ8_9BACT|nr:hypothetical protein [Fibrisoma montanum]RIV27044.1 hypothetical protein DYU11_01630 [Fibrisoma montanum]
MNTLQSYSDVANGSSAPAFFYDSTLLADSLQQFAEFTILNTDRDLPDHLLVWLQLMAEGLSQWCETPDHRRQLLWVYTIAHQSIALMLAKKGVSHD